MSEAFDEVLGTRAEWYDEENEEHVNLLKEAAINREGIFETKPKKIASRIFKYRKPE